MAKVGTLKKESQRPSRKSAATPTTRPTDEVAPSPEWEVRETCKTWEEADRFREAIINNSQRAARVRWEQPNYIVEWRS